MAKLQPAVPIEAFTSFHMQEFSQMEVFGKVGLVLYFGKNKQGNPISYIMGEVPEYNVRNVKILYNAGWSQRQIGLLYGIVQSRISVMLRDRTVNIPRVN